MPITEHSAFEVCLLGEYFSVIGVCLVGGWVNQAYSRLSITHGHFTDCYLVYVLEPSCTRPACGQSLYC